jgi:hypothetical protein
MKLAFCFLSYGDIVQTALWKLFFKDADPSTYTIVIHMSQGPSVSALEGAIVIPTRPTGWGQFNLVEAQQALFDQAIDDPAVQKCVLLSGDSIPLYNFTTIYSQLMSDDKGYLAYVVPSSRGHKSREGQVRKKAWPRDRPWKWYVASQWTVLHRSHVTLLRDNWALIQSVFNVQDFIADEHTYPVFFNGFGQLPSFHTTPIMRVSWSGKRIRCRHRHRSAPLTFHTPNFNEQTLKQIYDSGCLFMRKLCATVDAASLIELVSKPTV